MDLSLSISSALRLLGDASKTQHVTFQEVLHKVAQDLKFESNANTITPEAHVIDGGVVTHCHAALSTLFVESVRGGHNTSVLTSTLEDLNWPPGASVWSFSGSRPGNYIVQVVLPPGGEQLLLEGEKQTTEWIVLRVAFLLSVCITAFLLAFSWSEWSKKFSYQCL